VEELPELLPQADVVVVVVPVTPETTGMVDAAFLAAMKDGALLVNAARGEVVDTAALLAELEAGRLRAALDVTDPEPLPPGHPLWSAPGLLLTPHVAGTVPQSNQRAAAAVTEQVARVLADEPLASAGTIASRRAAYEGEVKACPGRVRAWVVAAPACCRRVELVAGSVTSTGSAARLPAPPSDQPGCSPTACIRASVGGGRDCSGSVAGCSPGRASSSRP
jgi:hypothetical protein